MMGKVIVCYCIDVVESEGTDPGRSSVSTGETNDIQSLSVPKFTSVPKIGDFWHIDFKDVSTG